MRARDSRAVASSPPWEKVFTGRRGSSLRVFSEGLHGWLTACCVLIVGKNVRSMVFATVRGSSRRFQNVLEVLFAKVENVPERRAPGARLGGSQPSPAAPSRPPPRRLVTIHLPPAATLHHLRLTALRAAVVPSLRTLRSSRSDLVGLSRKPGIAPIGGLGPVLHLRLRQNLGCELITVRCDHDGRL